MREVSSLALLPAVAGFGGRSVRVRLPCSFAAMRTATTAGAGRIASGAVAMATSCTRKARCGVGG